MTSKLARFKAKLEENFVFFYAIERRRGKGRARGDAFWKYFKSRDRAIKVAPARRNAITSVRVHALARVRACERAGAKRPTLVLMKSDGNVREREIASPYAISLGSMREARSPGSRHPVARDRGEFRSRPESLPARASSSSVFIVFFLLSLSLSSFFLPFRHLFIFDRLTLQLESPHVQTSVIVRHNVRANQRMNLQQFYQS